MRRLLTLVLPLVVFSVLGCAQTESRYLPPQIGWSLSEVAENVDQTEKAITSNIYGSPEGVWRSFAFQGRLFEYDGDYILGFDSSKRFVGGTWDTHFSRDEDPYRLYNSFLEEFRRHNYVPERKEDTIPALPTDNGKMATFYRDSTIHYLTWDDTLIDVLSWRKKK